MEVFEAIRKRRSIRQFDQEHQLSDDDLKRLIEAGCLAPTSFNIQNWHFVAVRDKAVQLELRAVSFNQAQVEECSVTLILTGRLDAHEDPSRVLRNASDDLQAMFTGMIKGFYGKDADLSLQEACRSVAFAGQNIMLAACAMGLDSCAMIGFQSEEVTRILGLPETHPPLLMLTIGKAIQPPKPRMGLLDFEEVLSVDRFGHHPLTGTLDES